MEKRAIRFVLCSSSLILFGWGLGLGFGFFRASPSKADTREIGCSAEVDEIEARVRDYVKQARVRGSGSSEKLKLAERDLLSYVRDRESGPCFEEIAAAYAESSFWELFGPFASKDGRGLSTKETLIRMLISELKSKHSFYPIGTADRSKLGDEWIRTVERSGKQVPEIIGAYDCSATKILFDPFLRPFNLGAVIFHELDHLLRDKLTYGKEWPRTKQRASLKELFVLDEVAANAMGALAQFRFYADSNRRYPSERPERKKAAFEFLDDGDLSLFSKNGSIAAIWKKLLAKIEAGWSDETAGRIRHDRRADRINHFLGFSDGAESEDYPREGVPLFGGFDQVYEGLLNENAIEDLEAIVRLVAQEYFPEEKIDAKRLARLFQDWLKETRQTGENGPSPLEIALSYRFRAEDFGMDISYRETFYANTLFDVSAGCKEFQEKAKSGELGKGFLLYGREGSRPSIGLKACRWPEERF